MIAFTVPREEGEEGGREREERPCLKLLDEYSEIRWRAVTYAVVVVYQGFVGTLTQSLLKDDGEAGMMLNKDTGGG